MRKVLIAIASELDGHAGADAVQASVPKFTKENIEELIIQVMTDDEDTVVNVRRIDESKGNIYHIYGEVYDQDFAAVVAPIKFTHLGTCTG